MPFKFYPFIQQVRQPTPLAFWWRSEAFLPHAVRPAGAKLFSFLLILLPATSFSPLFHSPFLVSVTQMIEKDALVVQSYKAKQPNELSLEMGQPIVVLSDNSPSWWIGRLPCGKEVCLRPCARPLSSSSHSPSTPTLCRGSFRPSVCRWSPSSVCFYSLLQLISRIGVLSVPCPC